MVEHNSKEVVDKMSQDLKIQPAVALPREISKNIQAVYDVTPKGGNIFMGDVTRITTGTSTIITTDANKDSFLTSALLSASADNISEGINYILSIVPLGKTAGVLLQLRKEPTTAFTGNQELTFNPPIQLERGSIITITQGFALGTSTVSGTVLGFERDPL